MRVAQHWIAGLLFASACAPNGAPVTPAVAHPLDSPKELLWGPCAAGALGDVVMENGLLLAVISRKERSSGFAVSPGNLVDLTPLPAGEDHLNEVFLYLNEDFPRQARYDAVEIRSAGGARRPAVVLARGADSKDPRVRIETEYRLEPGTRWLTIVSRFTSSATAALDGYRIGDAIQWGRTQAMAPGHGRNLPGRRVAVPWLASLGEGTSYAFVPDGQRTFDTPSGNMWSDPIGVAARLEPRETFTYVRHVVVGRGDTASLAPAIARLRGDAVGRISGSVREGAAPIADAEVHVQDAQGVLAGVARADKDGGYTIDLAPGDYTLRATAPGRKPSQARGPERVEPGHPRTLHFALGPRAILRWRVDSEDGRAPPVKLTIEGLDGTASPDLGPVFRADGAERYLLSARGAGELPIGPGHYRVHISRGPEFELLVQEIRAEEGAQVLVAGKLRRSYSTPGFISTDLHQHAAPSFDSGVSLEDRALSNAAEGVEVLVSSDHNVLTDFRPIIARTGLGRSVISVVGTEATTHSVGHFNALPLRYSATELRGGMSDPEGWTPRQIFDHLRSLATPSGSFLQVNHPRSKKTGYFTLMGLDPSTGTAADPRYASDFDGLEVIAFGEPAETDRVLEDWFSLLRRGHRITAVGTSDSHAISLREVGWARTYVCVDDDDPPRLDVRAFVAALRAGCASASGGPFITLRAGLVRMGGLVQLPEGRPSAGRRTLTVDVEVLAPSWIPTDRLRLYVDGRVTEDLRLEERGVLRASRSFDVACAADCFVVARVDGDRDLSPIVARREDILPLPVALTNPIYVDADGDGKYKGQVPRQE